MGNDGGNDDDDDGHGDGDDRGDYFVLFYLTGTFDIGSHESAYVQYQVISIRGKAQNHHRAHHSSAELDKQIAAMEQFKKTETWPFC